MKTYATKLAKNEAEAADFCRSIEGLAEVTGAALLLKGGRHWLGKRQTAKVAKFNRDAINKTPYDPRAMETMLSKEGTLTSTTLPPRNAPNVKMAGQHKERSIVINAETNETITQRVTFDQRGFPIFDPYVKVETRIVGDLGGMQPGAHKRAATRQLRSDIEAGKIDKKMFSDAEFEDIKDGIEKIGEYTWHHHQDQGRMQLVPEDIHEWARHIGGDALWGITK